jgi:hypothetical protein
MVFSKFFRQSLVPFVNVLSLFQVECFNRAYAGQLKLIKLLVIFGFSKEMLCYGGVFVNLVTSWSRNPEK